MQTSTVDVLADMARGRKRCAPPPPEMSSVQSGPLYGRLTLVPSPELVMVKVPAVATGV